jgi:hypothetical protein
MIFFMILITLLFITAKSANMAAKTSAKTKKKECPPHAWVYGEDGFLVCSVCHLTPGYSGRE